MRTTVTLDEALVRELMESLGVKTKTQAVVRAIQEELRRAKLRNLSILLGKIDFDEDALKAARNQDCQRAERLFEMGALDES